MADTLIVRRLPILALAVAGAGVLGLPACRGGGVDAAGAASPAGTAAARAPAEFGGSAWDDGMALVQVYRGRVRVYGAWRSAEVRDYMVREHLDPADLTKRDQPTPTTIPVLKANRMTQFETGSYGYRLMTSAFWRRGAAALVKGVGSCQNACGAVFLRWDAASGVLRADSYWEHEGRREWPLPAEPDRRFADELPFVAPWLADGALIELLPPLAATRLGDGSAAGPTAPTGRAVRVLRSGGAVQLRDADGAVVATYEHDAQGELVAWSIAGAEEFRRVARWRGPYWQRTADGDRALVGGR
jgi:hypothetical protein